MTEQKGVNMKYDSEKDTRKHIAAVGHYLLSVINRITFRIVDHDSSKMKKHEKPCFDKYTSKLADSTYGSEKYNKFLKGMAPALEHHYCENRHHPEFHMRTDKYIFNMASALGCMNLIDIIEMLCDWKAATERHKDGDIFKSIELNQKRFRYSNELKDILINTARYLCMVSK